MTFTPQPFVPDTPPPLHAERLLYVATGGVQTMFMPMWLRWLHNSYPHMDIRCVMTHSARRFAGVTAVAAANDGRPPMIDNWPEEPHTALHVELAAWPDAILVHPATLHFTARLALGLADTPTLLALQCTQAPIVVCPALPPGGHLNPAYRQHVEALSLRDNISVLPPISGISMSTGEEGLGTAALLPHAVAALEDLRSWQQEAAA
ncbi:flavoprotein [Streptomyces sp. NPDC088746]|uniref:flavoprotein n=1 Tax=Streptomyces sp. NPDC088746 TaxID=3365885 RepID=UPI003823A2F5